MKCEILLVNKLINNSLKVYLNNKFISNVNLNDEDSLIKYKIDYSETLLGANIEYIISNKLNNSGDVVINILFEIDISKNSDVFYKSIGIKQTEVNNFKRECNL